MIEFLGHFHPLLVHLPIGILLVALMLQWLSTKSKYASLKPAVAIILLWGTITALISCITGYFLSISDDYDRSLVNWHMWMATGVMVTSAVLYTKEKNPMVEVPKKLLSVGLFFLLMITGHLGGSLTHGSDYLIKPFLKIFNNDSVENTSIKPLANAQEAFVYKEVIQPVLQIRCYSCHNANKQKGRLRMDDINFLIKGGKHGKIININNADSSEMIKRLLLPVDNEHHMPPKEKPQPTENQIALLQWWINNHADFKKKVKELDQPVKIKPILLALQHAEIIKKVSTDIPFIIVEKADDKTVNQLTQKGIVILPVAQNSNYLMATFIEDSLVKKEDVELLLHLKKQLIWLNFNNAKIEKNVFEILPKLSNLIKLNLSNTNITDEEAAQLSSLENLHYLNLVGTKVTAKSILPLKKLKFLKSLFLYQTAIAREDYKTIKSSFPKTHIDSGNYFVPLLASDTTEVKAPKKTGGK